MLQAPSAQTCQLFGKTLRKVKELGFGRNGIVVLVQDTAGKQYVLKYSHNGADLDEKEYAINNKLGRAHGFQKNVPQPFFESPNNQYDRRCNIAPNCEVLLLDYLPDYTKDGYSGFASKKEKNLLKALRMIEALEDMLNKGILQDDVKLCNFVSYEQNNDFKVDVIDFGNASIVGRSSPQDRKKHEKQLVSDFFEQACFDHDWAAPILKDDDYEMFEDLTSFQAAKNQLQKMLHQENPSRNYSQNRVNNNNNAQPNRNNNNVSPVATTPYFAYGSNLDIAQMNERVGFTGEPTTAKLTGYKLVFNKYAVSRGCGVANIVYTGNPADVVEGVVYQLTNAQLAKLDTNEGANSSNRNGYKRKEIQLANGTPAQVYIATIDTPDQRLTAPTAEYMKHLLRGRRNGFISESYFNKLGELQVKEGGKLKANLNMQAYQLTTAQPATPARVVPVIQPRPVPATVLQSPAPVIFSDRNDPQAYLTHCVDNGLQIGAVKALNRGARLTQAMFNKLNDPVYQLANRKMMLAMAPYMQNNQPHQRLT